MRTIIGGAMMLVGWLLTYPEVSAQLYWGLGLVIFGSQMFFEDRGR